MKTKHFKTFAAILFTAATIATVSCKKDKEDDSAKPVNAPASIAETTWGWEDEGVETIEGQEVHYHSTVTLTFATETTGSLSFTDTYDELPSENEEGTADFTYTYNAPSGTMTFATPMGSMAVKFTIDGNNLTMYPPDSADPDEEPVVLTRR